jgi:hypothetical protein
VTVRGNDPASLGVDRPPVVKKDEHPCMRCGISTRHTCRDCGVIECALCLDPNNRCPSCAVAHGERVL